MLNDIKTKKYVVQLGHSRRLKIYVNPYKIYVNLGIQVHFSRIQEILFVLNYYCCLLSLETQTIFLRVDHTEKDNGRLSRHERTPFVLIRNRLLNYRMIHTLMCLSIGTPKILNFPFVPNGKLSILGVPILKHITVYFSFLCYTPATTLDISQVVPHPNPSFGGYCVTYENVDKYSSKWYWTGCGRSLHPLCEPVTTESK